MFELHVYKNRTRDFTVQLFESNGTTEVLLAAGDVVRVKVGRGTDTPALDLNSLAATASGSSVTFDTGTNDVELRIAQGDTSSLTAGAYDAEISVVDSADSNLIKHCEAGTVFIHPTLTGAIAAS